MLTGVVGSLAGFYHDNLNILDPEHRKITAHRLIAKLPTIAAACQQTQHPAAVHVSAQRPVVTAETCCMMILDPLREFEIDPVVEKALDVLFILHADHEQNASTSTVRLAWFVRCQPCCCDRRRHRLFGVRRMAAPTNRAQLLDQIGDVSNIDKFVAKAKGQSDPVQADGLPGHRVSQEPTRAKIIKGICHQVPSKYGNDRAWNWRCVLKSR